MFRDVSDQIEDNPPFRGYGAAVVRGRDGPLVFVAGYGDANRLYTVEDDRLVDTATGIVADEERYAIGVGVGDADADGCEEIYVHNTDSFGGLTGDTDLLLDRDDPDRMVWTDTFSLDVNAERHNFRAGRSVAAVDRFGTGRYGFCVASYGTQTRFYELGDDGEVTDMADAVGLEFTGGGRTLLPVPLVSDRMDVFVGVEDGRNRLFKNTGGHFEDVTAAAGVGDAEENARGATLVDEDGTLALALGNWEGPNRLYRRTDSVGQPDGGNNVVADDLKKPDDVPAFENVASPSFAECDSVRTVVAADFDNDGREELFVNAIGESNRLVSRRADDAWTEVPAGAAAEPAGLGTGAIVGDLDADGVLELLIVHGEADSQPLSLYEADATGDWLRISPTTQYGAPARGAVVDLETTAGPQRRVVDAGSGYLCVSEPVAHFGLGDAEPIEATVRWPDGREETLTDLEACTAQDVTHPVAPRF